MKSLVSEEIPKEVADRLRWDLDGYDTEDLRVAFFEKRSVDRSDAWSRATKIVPSSKEKNPWRKSHGENYWIWYIPSPAMDYEREQRAERSREFFRKLEAENTPLKES